MQYLKDRHLSLQEIAMLLGYSEQSAFQRAFKQWTAQTPQQWRLEYLNQPV
jgi:AraC-like DNA-binding protein